MGCTDSKSLDTKNGNTIEKKNKENIDSNIIDTKRGQNETEGSDNESPLRDEFLCDDTSDGK